MTREAIPRSGSDVATNPPRQIACLVGVAVWLVYITTAGGSLGTGDAVAMYEEAKAIAFRGAMDVPLEQSIEAWRGVDGLYYTPFGIGQPLFDIPFMLAGRVVAGATGLQFGDPDTVPKAFVALASTIPAAITTSFGFLLAWRLSSDLRASLVAAFALAFATLLWPYSKFGFNAALTAATLAGGVYGVVAGWLTKRPATLAAGGLGLGSAMLTRHEMTLAAVASLAWLAWEVRRHREQPVLILSASAGVLAAGSVWLLLNYVRFQNPVFSGHRPVFSFAGAWAFVASPSGALLLYAPVAVAVLGLIPLALRGNVVAQLFALVTIVMAAFYSSLEDWLGTRSYGPRYLVPLLPFCVAALAVWWRDASRSIRTALTVLCGIGFLLQIPAIVVDFSRVGIAAGQPPAAARRDEWRWAPLWLNARLAADQIPNNVRYATGAASPPAPSRTPSASLSERLAFSLDFWWLYLFYLGALSRVAIAALVLVTASAAAVLIVMAYRRATPV